MSKPLTDAELEEAERLDKAATSAPWPAELEVAYTTDRLSEVLAHDDVAVVLAARNALPRLVAEVTSSRARIEKLEAQIQHMGNTAHQGWHSDSEVGWRECDRPYCRDALGVLDEDPA